MENLAVELKLSVPAVAALGSTSAQIDSLSDAAALAGQKQITDARRRLDTFAAWMAASLARRSRPELGDAGLAAQHGFVNPEAMIQKMSGSTRGEATRLVAVGTMTAETDAADTLAGAAARLLAEAPTLNADQLFRLARRMRDALDEGGIAARQKQYRDDRYWRVWLQRNGMVRIDALLDPENGQWALAALDAVTSPRRGGPRFVDEQAAAWAEAIISDQRSTEQIAADAFVQMLRIAAEADPGRIFGGRRPAVRVIVAEKVLTERAGHGHLDGNPAPIPFDTIERHLCDAGTVGT